MCVDQQKDGRQEPQRQDKDGPAPLVVPYERFVDVVLSFGRIVPTVATGRRSLSSWSAWLSPSVIPVPENHVGFCVKRALVHFVPRAAVSRPYALLRKVQYIYIVPYSR